MPRPLQLSALATPDALIPLLQHIQTPSPQIAHSNSETKCIFTTKHVASTFRVLGAQSAGSACKVERVVLVVPCGAIVTHVVLHIQRPSTKSSATAAHESTSGPHHLSVMGCHRLGASVSV
jgi:hypothetical protein